MKGLHTEIRYSPAERTGTRNVPAGSIAALERAHRLIYRGNEPIETALATVLSGDDDPFVKRLAEFLRTRTTLAGPARKDRA